ncbi:MAG: hypothetical protein HQ518_08645 [Rhodopirellula sp.]|nr:hypothetical protein [Rhodopirellula sp.]
MPDTSNMTDRLINDVVDRVADAVTQRLLDRIPELQAGFSQSAGLVDEPTMAGIAKVSQQSLQRRRRANEIPFVQCGRRVLYQPDEVIAALSSKNGGDA